MSEQTTIAELGDSLFGSGPDAALNLRAANLIRFCELAEGVDERTFDFHLRSGDYSRWMREPLTEDEALEFERSALCVPTRIVHRQWIDRVRSRASE